MNLLICLGGTGQLVLHYFIQWHLLGFCDSIGPLRALVIDQDKLNKGIEFAKDFFLSLSMNNSDLLIDNTPAPWIRYTSLPLHSESAQLKTLLMRDDNSMTHPARAYLDSGSL